MSLYDLPKFDSLRLESGGGLSKFFRNKASWVLILTILVSSFFGFLAGAISGGYLSSEIREQLARLNIIIPESKVVEKETIVERQSIYLPQTSQEEATINVVKEASPAVVSIIVSKDLPVIEEYYINPFPEFFGQEFQIPQYRQNGTQRQEIGGGTGFIISPDGMILTNKHVVADTSADYTVLTNDGKKLPAKVLARDPVQDLAVIKVDQEKLVDKAGQLTFKPFSTLALGDSDKLQIGQTVVAIGNALGEFQNTVSVGVISGLGRTITASGGGLVETLEGVIQTDAAINKG
ncbi:MAG: trypsin-like peptidase domain-containing protein, partial [bacterium]|nr:trypsin-like peptidase domain-containing protein [bacterium]